MCVAAHYFFRVVGCEVVRKVMLIKMSAIGLSYKSIFCYQLLVSFSSVIFSVQIFCSSLHLIPSNYLQMLAFYVASVLDYLFQLVKYLF